jgi:hypothetical protein
MRAEGALGTCCPLQWQWFVVAPAKQQVPHRAFGPIRNDKPFLFGPIRNDKPFLFGPIRNDKLFLYADSE